ncbi:ABC transporter substrate-binding protein [Pacificimonas sp. ICDLI1SI03]
MRRPRFAFCALVTMMAASLIGCSTPGAPSPDGQDLRIRANTGAIESAPLLYAARDFYPGGLPVEKGAIPNLVGAENIAGVFDAGPADVATHAETQALRYSIEHPEIRIILTLTEGHYRIVARRSAGIETLSDLKGKRIATIPTTSAGYFVHRMLQKEDLGFSDIEAVRVPIDEMANALATRQVDAVAIWDPYGERAAQAVGDDLISFTDPEVYSEMFNLNTTTAQLQDPAKRQQIVTLVRAIIDASSALQTDPEAAQRLAAERTGFALEDVTGSWSHLSFPAAIPDKLLDIMVAEEVWLAQQEGRSPRSREAIKGLIDSSIYEEALAR